MLGPGWTVVVALVAAYGIAALGTPSPAVTPASLLYNVVATPGALYRYWRQGQTGGRVAGGRPAVASLEPSGRRRPPAAPGESGTMFRCDREADDE
jgi:hypothetical protein